jgi:hypothetical protein
LGASTKAAMQKGITTDVVAMMAALLDVFLILGISTCSQR